MCSSFSTIFGVVPEEIREWKPETAPQAMVMNRNGKSFAGKDGAGAVDEARGRGAWPARGARSRCRAPAPLIVPILRKVLR
jgi:hypothetical protein